MEPDRLDAISKIYQEALLRGESERAAFLKDACAGDESLRQEVESLLKHDDAAAGFIDVPAFVAAAREHAAIDDGKMTGRQIGSYTFGTLVGSGGMGDVYRARDSRLQRDVAIKLLPPAFVADASRRTRFEREARLLATLNHPNIAQVHGLEESDGIQALVMEWVPGETLSQMIGHGAVPSAQALSIARQIADAVDAAHESGILHRDLKPANIKVRPDGTVKVLDFGLAKAFAAEGTTSGSEHTGTADGAILGTVPYMSPEQARGTPVDKRTDIWAFGCVLYELLTGRPAFAGPTLTDTLAAILEREPDWSRLPPTTPARVRELVQRCLVKDPRRRLRDIGDARLDLEALELPATPATSSTAPRTRERAWMGIAALATLGAAWLGGSTYFTTRPAPDPVSFTVSPPEGQVLGPFAMSPDGRHVAFVAGSENTAIWVRALDSPALRRLEGTEGAVGFAWSPDGRSVAFTDQPTNGKVKRVARTGGAPQTVTESGGAGLAWGDGVILVSGADGRLYRVPERGGDLVAVTSLDPSRQENMLRAQPQFLPDGRFLFQTAGQDASKRGLFLGSLDSSRTHLLDGLMTAAYADGHLLYNRDATLMAQPFDDRAARFTGEAFPTIERILTDQGGGAAFSVAQNGTLAYRTAGGSASGTLAWFDRQGKRVGTVGGPGSYENPRLSPDGRWLAACRREGGQRDIWTVDLERNVPTKLTSDPGDDNYPVWSSDGTRVIFVSNRSGSEDLYWRAADGSGSDERLVTSPEIKRPTSVSRDGTLLYTVRTRPGNVSLDVWSLSLAANHKPVPVLTDPGANEYNTAFSPDGRWIAFNRGEGDGTPQVYVQAFPATGGRVRVSTSSGTAPQWSSDGRQLFYVSQGSLAVVDMSQPLRPGVPQALPVRWNWRNILVIDRAGERFLRPVTGEADADEPITVIVNWTSTLPRK